MINLILEITAVALLGTILFFTIIDELKPEKEKDEHKIENIFFDMVLNDNKKMFDKHWKQGGELYFFNFTYNDKEYSRVSLMLFKSVIDNWIELLSKEDDEWRKEIILISLLNLSKETIQLNGGIRK